MHLLVVFLFALIANLIVQLEAILTTLSPATIEQKWRVLFTIGCFATLASIHLKNLENRVFAGVH
jgi:hypothetical protein